MPGQTLTIEFPRAVHLPERLRNDQEFLRYLLVGALYTNGTVTGREARELTGDSRRAFEEKMAKYGFPLMPAREEDLVAELNA